MINVYYTLENTGNIYVQNKSCLYGMDLALSIPAEPNSVSDLQLFMFLKGIYH